MGVMNALMLADQTPETAEMREAIAMASRNAERLNRTLATLIDLAAIDQSSFGVRLGEGFLSKHLQSFLDAKKIPFELSVQQEEPCLLDSKQFNHALELIWAIITKNEKQKHKIRITTMRDAVCATLEIPIADENFPPVWAEAWKEARVALAGGTTKSSSLFHAAAQSESGFLSTGETGIGAELVVMLEIMRLHHAQAEWKFANATLMLTFEFPQLRGREGLMRALSSRMHLGKQELSSLGLIWIEIPRADFREEMITAFKQSLFRESDSIYRLDAADAKSPQFQAVALLANDCKRRDVPVLLTRLLKPLPAEIQKRILLGAAHFPEDAVDPEVLVQIAKSNVRPNS